MTQYTITYAQNREDVLLNGFFKKETKGFYVDVGASDPRLFSVTRKFYEEGWRGINIEPNKALFDLLEVDRPEDINLNIGVADKNGSLTLREYPDGDGLSTFSPSIKQLYTEHTTYETNHFKDYEVPVRTLQSIFEQNQVKTIHFMKVDVEGFEYEVLAGNDWDTYRPLVLCIESEHIVKDWRPMLQKNNYTRVFFDGLNEYYVANEHPEITENFSYIQAMFAIPPIPADFIEQLQMANWKTDQIQRKLIQKEILIQNLQSQIQQLHLHINSQKRIRSLIKQLAQAVNVAILLHIEKLNKPVVHTQSPLRLKNTSDAKSRIRELQKYDFNSYYGVQQKQSLTYRILNRVYPATRRALWNTALRAYQIMRRTRRHA